MNNGQQSLLGLSRGVWWGVEKYFRLKKYVCKGLEAGGSRTRRKRSPEHLESQSDREKGKDEAIEVHRGQTTKARRQWRGFDFNSSGNERP